MVFWKRALFLFLCFLMSVHLVRSEIDPNWIDPHDMSPVYDKEYFPYDVVPEAKNVFKGENCVCDSETQSNAYLKRIVNMLINAVYEDSFNDNLFRGHLVFEIDINKFSKLHEFANDRYNNLHEIDSILSEILKKPKHDVIKQTFLNYFWKIFKMISSRSGILGICVLSYVFVIYKMLKGNLNYWAIFKFLFINLVIFDFAFVWIRLYQKAEINKLAISKKYDGAPDICNPKTMKTMQYIRSLFSSVDECKEYHHVTLTDIFWTVSPGDVFTEMVTKSITEPMKAIGPAVGHFIYGIYGALPFPINVILLPVALIFVMIMSCITLSFVLKIPIRFNFFHLISWSFGGDNGQQTNGNVLTGQTVEKLLDIVKENNTPRFTATPAITEELISKIERQISQNDQKRTLQIKDDYEEEMSHSFSTHCQIERKEKSSEVVERTLEASSEVKSDLEKETSLCKPEECLEVERRTPFEESSEEVSKVGFEPDVKCPEEQSDLRKRKRNDGAGDS